MRELGRLWDWILPGLISQCPMVAIAYYNACAEKEASQSEAPRVGQRVVVFDALPVHAIIPLVHQ
jgi:hypothetical protein